MRLTVNGKEQELDILYYLVAARLCTSVCNSAYTKKQKPDSEYITVSEKPAWDLLRKWLTINPIKAKDEFRKAAGFTPSAKQSLQKNIPNSRAKKATESPLRSLIIYRFTVYSSWL